MLYRIDQAWRGHYLEAIVYADEELGRNHRALNGAELCAFDLPRNRAELAGRIDFRLDAAAGILLQRSSVVLGEEEARVIERRQRELHRVGFVLRLRVAAQHQRRGQQNCAGRRSGARSEFPFDDAHGRLPPCPIAAILAQWSEFGSPPQRYVAAGWFNGTTAMASISNSAPSCASFEIWMAVEAGGAAVSTYWSRTSR